MHSDYTPDSLGSLTQEAEGLREKLEIAMHGLRMIYGLSDPTSTAAKATSLLMEALDFPMNY